MKLLLSNDDGIDAPGLAMLAEVASDFGEVTVVAPDRHLSGCGHQTTTDGPITVTEVGDRRFAIGGTPADCARIGLMHLATDVDWVLSGVNHGGNLGIDTAMSGTVAAVREASLFGKSGIAFSQFHRRRGNGSGMDWETVRPKLRAALQRLLSETPAEGHLWNVNFPDPGDHAEPVPEIVEAPLDLGPLAYEFEIVDGSQYTFRGRYHERSRTPGSDVDVCFSGRIALTHLPALVSG